MNNNKNISIISAMAKNRVIGRNNKLPWHIGKDLKYFKDLTKFKTIVMGRKTFESIIRVTNGKPLENRKNVVLTTDEKFKQEGFTIINNIEDILILSQAEEIMIIGGSKLYKDFIPHSKYLYLTEINQEFDGDVCFPEFNKDEFLEMQRMPQMESELTFDFVVYRRK